MSETPKYRKGDLVEVRGFDMENQEVWRDGSVIIKRAADITPGEWWVVRRAGDYPGGGVCINSECLRPAQS